MKVLFIAHFYENSGWSNAAINLVKAMHKVGIDVVCRNIKLTNSPIVKDSIIEKLEQKSIDDVDICIQNVLPHHIVGTGKFKKNIAYFVAESIKFKHLSWFEYLNLADEVWVPNNDLQHSLISDGFQKSVKVVPYPFDIDKYLNKENKNLSFKSNDHKFKFYYVGELNDRKNIESIIRCFHAEFASHEQVALVLKVKKFGSTPQQLHAEVKALCDNIKKQMRIYSNIESYHEEIIIADDVNSDIISMLHRSCDCFVGPSHGEGWSIPAFEAMCYGKTPICSNEGGPKDFINPEDKNTGYLINGIYNICNHANPAFMELFTGQDEWFVPSEQMIKEAMRFYYENKDGINRASGLEQGKKFSYDIIGNGIKEIINDN
jgi:glycosyltransferase involved in cell wall biosynthesis